MGTTVARLEAGLTLNDVQFERSIARAEQRGQTFAARWERTVTNAFKRDPGQRAENAIGRFVERVTAGDVAGSIQGLTGSMSAFGIASGAALGASIALFIRFRDQIKATGEATATLQTELINRPLTVVTKFTAEGMDQVLAAREKLADDLRAKQEASGTGASIWSGIKGALTGPTFGAISDKADAAAQLNRQRQLNQVDSEREQILMAQANLAQRMIDIQQQEVEGDRRLAGHAKTRLEKEQGIAALRAQGLTPDAFRIRSGALEQTQGLKDRQIDAAADAEERQLALEEKIANLKRQGLSADDEKKVRATSELTDLDSQIANENSPQRLRELRRKRQQKENEIRGFGNPNAPAQENQFAFGTIAAREFEENQGGFGTLKGREDAMNDPKVWGSLGANAVNRGDVPLPKNDPATISAEILKETKKTNEIMAEVWKKKGGSGK